LIRKPRQKKSKKRKHKSSSSESGSDEERDTKKKKTSNSQKPLKKRIQPEESEQQSSGSSSQSESELEDQAYLDSLGELEREKIIYERDERKRKQKERKELKKKLKTERRTSQRTEKQSRSTKEQTKQAALSDLKARREKKTISSRVSTYEDESPEEGEIEPEDPEIEEQPKQEELSQLPQQTATITLEDLQPIIVTRQKLIQWHGAPYFHDTIKGLFVRIGIGHDGRARVYRLAKINELVESESKSYQLTDKITTKMYLVLGIGNSEKHFRIEYISNAPVTQSEFDRWVREMQKHSLSEAIPDKTAIELLKKQIHSAENYTYTEEEISKMVEESRKKSEKPINIPREKQDILLSLDAAVANNDEATITTLQERLKKLEELEAKQAVATKPKHSLEQINDRNKTQNMTAPKTKRKGVTGDLDPFSRRPTKPQYLWLPPKKDDKEPDKKDEVEGVQPSTTTQETKPQEAKKEENIEETLLEEDPTIPADTPTPNPNPNPKLLKAHAFDFDIELSVNKSKPATGKTSQQSQKQSATLKNPDDKPKRKTLSLADYKKRRGLN